METSTLSMTIVGPPALAGTVLQLGPGRHLLGRGTSADLRIDDRYISGHHAAIDCRDGRVIVEDLGSANGTWIGGERLHGPRELHGGELVTFGCVDARLVSADATALLPRVDTPRPPPARFEVGQQHAGHVNNVGHNQYNSIVQQRESFLRKIAASRTRARFVFWTGLAMVFIGALGYAWFVVDAMGSLSTGFETGIEPDSFALFGPDAGFGPVGPIFFMIAFVGQFVLVVGLILWIVAAARVRRVDTDPRYPWNANAAR
ncbi:FHA domain-containing protein [Rhodococcus phenolicus]|uniref:FHA domain-containing protein n=1 Tax=Rhodococcus phenolicus TaxID=263849 RepID=UPI00082C9415|nr:FHA domain-containing protein [Rhodococcus phenolicus]